MRHWPREDSFPFLYLFSITIVQTIAQQRREYCVTSVDIVLINIISAMTILCSWTTCASELRHSVIHSHYA